MNRKALKIFSFLTLILLIISLFYISFKKINKWYNTKYYLSTTFKEFSVYKEGDSLIFWDSINKYDTLIIKSIKSKFVLAQVKITNPLIENKILHAENICYLQQRDKDAKSYYTFMCQFADKPEKIQFSTCIWDIPFYSLYEYQELLNLPRFQFKNDFYCLDDVIELEYKTNVGKAKLFWSDSNGIVQMQHIDLRYNTSTQATLVNYIKNDRFQ